MTRETERTKLIKHLKYNRSIGADYLITDKDADEIIKALEQEPCEDVISRQAVRKELLGLWNSSGDKDYCMETLRDFVVEAPPVTPARPKGKWVLLDEESNTWGCTHCKELGKDDWWNLNSGTPKDNKMDYCPHCGADMRGNKDGI